MMSQAIRTVASLCMLAALAEQLLGGGRLFGAVRMLLGLEILYVLLELIERICKLIG